MNKFDFTDKMLLSRAEDCVSYALRSYTPAFLNFLSESERAYLEKNLRYPMEDIKVIFYGGYSEAERTLAGIFPIHMFYDEKYDPFSDFSLSALHIKGSGFRHLSHRDFLGSVLSLGLKRETIGDIVVSADGFSAYMFCLEKTREYILSNLVLCANDKVKCTPCDIKDVFVSPKRYEEINTTVSSLRIDAVVSSCFNISREESSRLILSGLVEINHLPCTDKAFVCCEGDIISVRRKGRFKLSFTGDRNRRDRIRIVLHRYI